MTEGRRIWITWEKHRRTRELVSSLPGVELHLLEFEGPRIIRYPYLLWKTTLVLLQQQPQLVLVQNPSIVLALFMVTFGKLFSRSIVVDAHNEGLKPFYESLHWLAPIYRLIQRRAKLTIVTNKELAMKVRENKGRAFVLPDRIPEFLPRPIVPLRGEIRIVYICTFEKDEPYQEVIMAASFLPQTTIIYVTGNKSKAPQELFEKSPNNVIFTGFLSEDDYLSLIGSCDVVMDLTYMENCLVCGAYEALAMGKPMILSDTKALREYFSNGVVFTKNDAQSIAEAVGRSSKMKGKLQDEACLLRDRLRSDWEKTRQGLANQLDNLG